MDFRSCPVMKAFKCDVTKIKQEKKSIVNGLTELGGNWSVKLTVHFDSSVNYR